MSYVSMADFLAATVSDAAQQRAFERATQKRLNSLGSLSGRKGGGGQSSSQRTYEDPPQKAAEAGPGGQPTPSQQEPVQQAAPQQAAPQQAAPQQAAPQAMQQEGQEQPQQPQQPQQARPQWWGRGASNFFPPEPPAQSAPDAQYGQPQQQPYAPSGEPAVGGSLGAVIEYIRPAANLKEGSFESTAALEAGGDDMADDDSMGAEQMLYEGLTGGEADKTPSPGLSDSVDAGGQEPFVDVATMNSGGWEADDGTGIDALVEPGQVQQQAPAGRVDRASSYRTNSNGNGVQQASSSEPPVFRPAQNGNGAARNGAARNGASQNGNGAARNGANGVVPRNRITAFDSAAPYIQGTGAATAARPRGFDHVNPPNPAAFGLGQAPSTAAPAASPGFEIANRIAQAAGQVGTAVAVSRTPPQFRAGMPGGTDMNQYGQGQGQDQQSSSVMPWVLGALGVGVVGFGIWWITRPKAQPAQVADVAPAPAPQVVANRGRRSTKTKKNGSKKAKRR